jgi:tRNA-specific 2-thiouridylase
MDLSIYKGKKVLCGMSGGVDSSMVAVMLKKAGAMPIGLTFKLGDTKINLGSALDSSCCTIDDINDARAVAVRYEFPHMVIDLKAEFEKNVIDDFADKTIEGFTPNPCIMCNKTVKWGSMLRYAEMLGCDYIITGHYACLKNKNGRYFLSRPKDLTKDQTYFLYALTQENLSKTIFPLGDYLKLEVKQMVLDEGITTFIDKKESFDICFVGDGTYKEFMLTKYPHLSKLDGGDIVLVDGKVIGKHSGYPFYTIGQRKGLGISTGTPMYVLEIDVINNKLIVGPIDKLNINTAIIDDVNLMKYDKITDGLECIVKVRSLDKGTNAKLYNIGDGKLRIDFLTEVKGGVSFGQSAVMYEDEDVIGGGIIVKK